MPPEDARKADQNANNDGDKSDSSDNATGVEALKRRKRQREADDFFDEMNKEDPLMKQM